MTIGERLLEIDGNLLIGIQQSLGADWFTALMKVMSFMAEKGWFWIVLCLALIAIKKTRRVGIVCAASLLVAFTICNGVVKIAVDRARPFEIISGVQMMLPDPGDSSFPSGHSNCAMSVAWAMWLITRGQNEWHRWSYVAVVAALLTALSRVYLGMHFPSDAIAGMLLGMICATIVYTIFMKYEEKNGTINVGRKK